MNPAPPRGGQWTHHRHDDGDDGRAHQRHQGPDEQARLAVDDEMVKSRSRKNDRAGLRYPPKSLRFFRDLSAREKEEMDQRAAVILQLTANNDSTCSSSASGVSLDDYDNLSDITNAYPQLLTTSSTERSGTAAMETLGHILRDCDSFANPAEEFPFAVAELVSVCQERNSRLEAAEAMIRRLEEPTETLLAAQGQRPETIMEPSVASPGSNHQVAQQHHTDLSTTTSTDPSTPESSGSDQQPQPQSPKRTGSSDPPAEYPALAPRNNKKAGGKDPPIRDDDEAGTGPSGGTNKKEGAVKPNTHQNAEHQPQQQIAALDDAMVQSIIAVIRQELRESGNGTAPLSEYHSAAQNLVDETKQKVATANDKDYIVRQLSVAKLSGHDDNDEDMKPSGASKTPTNEPWTRRSSEDPPSVEAVSTLDPPAMDWNQIIEEHQKKQAAALTVEDSSAKAAAVSGNDDAKVQVPPATLPGAVNVSAAGAFRVSPRPSATTATTTDQAQSDREAREAEKTGLEPGPFLKADGAIIGAAGAIDDDSLAAAKRQSQTILTILSKEEPNQKKEPAQAEGKQQQDTIWEASEIYLEDTDSKPKDKPAKAASRPSGGERISPNAVHHRAVATVETSVLAVPTEPTTNGVVWDASMIGLKTDAVNDEEANDSASAGAVAGETPSLETVEATPVAPPTSSTTTIISKPGAIGSSIAPMRSSTENDGLLAASVALQNTDETIAQLTSAVITLQEELRRRDQEIPSAEIVKTGCQCIIL